MELSFLALMGVFVSGLALNLTPCVYPMLSVTVALFGGRQEKKLKTSFLRASVYFLGIILMYSSLGAAAALSGGFFGAVLQNSWVLILISVVMVILALSMFGIYEFMLPPQIVNWLGGTKRTGYVGIFLSGLLVGVFAAPCIGPPIVALFTVASQLENAAAGFWLFFVLAIGLGLPYLLLGTFSGLLKKLPKSGDWLIWVKKLFGVALLGLSFFYFALALYPNLLPNVWPIVLFGGAVYLGFLEKSGDRNLTFQNAKRILGVLVIGGVLVATFGRPKERVIWTSFSDEAFAQATEARKPVALEFFADWCIPCHELNRYTFTNPKVIQALSGFTRFRVDATNPTSEKTSKPLEDFNVLGVPTIIFFNSNGIEVEGARITGYVPPAEFLEYLDLVNKTRENGGSS
jgi:thioredoxin:protein disulfide reductase